MAGLMTASMVLIELPLMSAMYESRRRNAIIMAIGMAALFGFFLLIRQQTAISDRQFLRSMIPVSHVHSSNFKTAAQNGGR